MVHLNLKAIKEYGHEVLGCRGEISSWQTSKLDGGFSPARIFRVDLTFEDSRQTLVLAQKFTTPEEVQVMLALAELPDTHAIPEVIDYALDTDDKSANWFVTPFYAGNTLTFDDDVPADVVCSLAQLHCHFQSQVECFDRLYRIDVSFFQRTLAAAVRALEQKDDLAFKGALQDLRNAQMNDQVFRALKSLPVTLTHGDMHPINLIRVSERNTVLIDWGNARIAPAMLDIPNMIELDSKNWFIYLDAWREASGVPMDLGAAHLGYHWATVMVNTQYLPHAINFSPPKHVREMVDKVVAAERLIDELMK